MATINALQLPDPDKMTPVDLSPLGQIDEAIAARACCAATFCKLVNSISRPASASRMKIVHALLRPARRRL